MRGLKLGVAALGAFVLVFCMPPAAANPPKSRLTPIDLDECKLVAKRDGGRSWLCPGLAGYPVYVAERGRRYALSFGPRAESRRSALQSPSAVNSLFDGKRRPTVEWRIERLGGGREAPFATIVRFHARDGDIVRELLVVTKVTSKLSCHVAHVDATANPDAMALARNWADAHVRRQGCPARVPWVGNARAGQGEVR